MNFVIVSVIVAASSVYNVTSSSTPFTGAPEWCIRAANEYDRDVKAHFSEINGAVSSTSICRATDEQSAKALDDFIVGHFANKS